MHGTHASDARRRILIIDDTESIHRDYEKILGVQSISESEEALDALDSIMFADGEKATASTAALTFELDHALQGKEGYEKAVAALADAQPFSLAFVDMRMPPGWDGLQTIERIWEADRHIQIVICSAYADYTWNQIVERLGHSDRLLILKKPFDHAEVFQLAAALSEKWLSERTTRDLLATLEDKVSLRTVELSQARDTLLRVNRDLETAVDEAQCAARAKGRFLATMSHEIRTTLNGIMGAAQMLQNGSLPPPEQEFADIIQSSGEALMTIINDILDYSKYENGQLELESIPFSIRALAAECSALLEPVVRKNNVALSVSCDESVPTRLLGDPSRLRQVLLNLLNNAIKFGKDGPVSLSLACEALEGDFARLRIDIADKGIGMKPETMQRLFSAFMQADTSTTREFGGTGLGLAICKLLADAMDATIEAQSEPGKGSTFTFRVELPIAEAEEPAPRPSRMQQSAPSTHRADYSGKRVLLVDDNVVNRKLGKHFLSGFNLEVELANNGLEAVEKARAGGFDLILMDLQMPEMDGVDATYAIRKIEANAPRPVDATPIIALTANAFTEVREECTACGMNDFLTKPLRIDDLSRALERWLTPAPEEAEAP